MLPIPFPILPRCPLAEMTSKWQRSTTCGKRLSIRPLFTGLPALDIPKFPSTTMMSRRVCSQQRRDLALQVSLGGHWVSLRKPTTVITWDHRVSYTVQPFGTLTARTVKTDFWLTVSQAANVFVHQAFPLHNFTVYTARRLASSPPTDSPIHFGQ